MLTAQQKEKDMDMPVAMAVDLSLYKNGVNCHEDMALTFII